MATLRKLPKPAGPIDWVTQERDGWRLGGWTREFELVECDEPGLGGREDLVVMRPAAVYQSNAETGRRSVAPPVETIVTRSATESSDA